MNPFFYSEEAGAKGLPPLSPAPQIPAQPKPSLRSGRFQLTMPNTSSTIITPASVRSDCCSLSFRNAVRLPPASPNESTACHIAGGSVGWRSEPNPSPRHGCQSAAECVGTAGANLKITVQEPLCTPQSRCFVGCFDQAGNTRKPCSEGGEQHEKPLSCLHNTMR